MVVDSESKRICRPMKTKLQFPKRVLNTNLDRAEENTCFGIIKRCFNGEVVLPLGRLKRLLKITDNRNRSEITGSTYSLNYEKKVR